MSTPIPPNEASFSLQELLQATSGKLIVMGPGSSTNQVVIDSRRVSPGSLFVALRGERFDAHQFLPQVAELGAAVALVEAPRPELGALTQIQVPCTLTALGDVARAHRLRWGGLVLTVAGSAGKTTTKACVAAALEALLPGAVHGERGNLNNRVGAPMVLLRCQPHHQIAVVEVGTNQPGEVAELTRIAAPDLAVLTRIDYEHSEGLGELDAIEAEEGAALLGLRPGGVAIGNEDDHRVRRQLDRGVGVRRVSYGESPSSDYRLLSRTPLGHSGARLEVSCAVEQSGSPTQSTITLETPLLGAPGALATLAALAATDAVAARLERPRVSPEALSAALQVPQVIEPGRLAAQTLSDGSLLLDDSYNSNPGSVLSSLAAAHELATARGARLQVVLGEMLELGELSAREHARVGAELAAFAPSGVIAVQGEAARFSEAAAAQGIPSVFVADADAALRRLIDTHRAGDVLLIKGSRGVRLDRVVSALASG
ncbi:MAG: UDP-N-acetylmuramoyl-tripeptide--D-alanyl-D-alanine ligase, partial [Labilithrix sp.]|nr:UDP-N-acetylmuramoyl-tripeptide--D-alanyl-D-alanine ligase [Labilithrix sp.]